MPKNKTGKRLRVLFRTDLTGQLNLHCFPSTGVNDPCLVEAFEQIGKPKVKMVSPTDFLKIIYP